MQHGVTAMPMYSGAWCVYSAFFFVISRQVQARHPEATWTGKFQQAGGVIVSEQFFFFFLLFSLPPLQGSSCKKEAVPLRCSLSASACFIYFRWSFGTGESEKDTFLKPVFNFFKGEVEEELLPKIWPQRIQFCAKWTTCFCVYRISGGWVGHVCMSLCVMKPERVISC